MSNRLRRGTALIEFCFILPWYVFLFVGAFDYGFYSYSLIATTNAARVSAYYCANNSSQCSSTTTACQNYVIGQLKFLPNVGSGVTTCTASPVTLTISYPGTPSTGCPDGNACVTSTVAYVTPQLIPIPGLLPSQLTITKATTMRLRN
jgi:Flp pilus assembly protein TadG